MKCENTEQISPGYITGYIDSKKIVIQVYPYDGGKSQSKRPRQTNDCAVIAIALATETDYDTVYDRLKAFGRKCSQGTDKKIINKYLQINAKANYISFPAEKGKKRMNILNFCHQFQMGTFIIRVSKHVAVVKDGKLYNMDPFIDPFKCVYCAWKVDEGVKRTREEFSSL